MTDSLTGLQTVYDLFYRAGYYCQFCGAFRTQKNAMIKHIKSWHSEAVRRQVEKMQSEDQA